MAEKSVAAASKPAKVATASTPPTASRERPGATASSKASDGKSASRPAFSQALKDNNPASQQQNGAGAAPRSNSQPPGAETAGLSNAGRNAGGPQRSDNPNPPGDGAPPPADPVDAARQQRGAAELAKGQGTNGVAPAHGYEVATGLRDGLQGSGGDSISRFAQDYGFNAADARAANAQIDSTNDKTMQPGNKGGPSVFMPLTAPTGISDGSQANPDGSPGSNTIEAVNTAIAAKGTPEAENAKTAVVNSLLGDLNNQADPAKNPAAQGMTPEQLRGQAALTVNGDAETYGLNDWSVGASNRDIVSPDAGSVSARALDEFNKAHADLPGNPGTDPTMPGADPTAPGNPGADPTAPGNPGADPDTPGPGAAADQNANPLGSPVDTAYRQVNDSLPPPGQVLADSGQTGDRVTKETQSIWDNMNNLQTSEEKAAFGNRLITPERGATSDNQDKSPEAKYSALDQMTAQMGYTVGTGGTSWNPYSIQRRDQAETGYTNLAEAAAQDQGLSDAAGLSLARATPLNREDASDRVFLKEGGFAQAQDEVASGNTALRDSYARGLKRLGDEAPGGAPGSAEQQLKDDYYAAAASVEAQ